MKKILYFILSFILIFSLTGCSNTNNELVDWTEQKYEQTITVDGTLVKEGKLVVATSPDYAPYAFLDIKQSGQKKYQGADIFLASFIAQKMGLELEILETSFENCPSTLNSPAKADIVLSGITYSYERDNNFDFTDIYFEEGDGGHVLVVLDKNFDKFNKSLETIKQEKNIVIGAQDGSIQQELVNLELEMETEKFSKIADGLNLLKKGSLDAICLPKNSADDVCAKDPSFKYLTEFKFNPEVVAKYEGTRGLVKNNSDLIEEFNEAIKEAKELFPTWIKYASDYSLSLALEQEELQSNFFVRMYSILKNYGLQFLKGTGVTLLLSLITVIFGTIIALGLSYIRRSRFKGVRAIGTSYVEFVRGIPLLLLLWLLYMISPASWPAYVSVTIALFLNSGAYVAEIIRAGLGAVDKGQYEAARTLGLSKFKTMKKVVLPQAIKKILPALGNEFVSLIKETSLASVFFIGDLMTIKNNITAITYLSIEPFIIVGIIYFTLTFGITKLIGYAEKKMGA